MTANMNPCPPCGNYGLLDHLKACCATNPDYEVLFAALKLDVANYSDMLESISLSFGNYSKHDSTHSRAIVRHLEQLLGREQISRLSATDTWMLLEVAYCHDIGMALSENEITTIWKSESFKTFLLSLFDRSNRELLKIAEDFFDTSRNEFRPIVEVLNRIQQNGEDGEIAVWNLGARIRSLVAEYTRSSHAVRSGTILKATRWGDEDTCNGIQNRLYKLCGECALAHGLNRNDVVSEEIIRLPYVTNGFSSDYAHPRFVAMLLRMGDLFDIDNDRFNKYVTAAYGKLSPVSSAHKDKHRCITHLYISPETIELRADLTRLIDSSAAVCCEDDADEIHHHLMETYKETQNWFTYISDELDFWHSNGHEFLPAGFFYPVPSLTRREIIIKDHEYGKEELLKRFTITYERANQIFGSRPFYREPLSFIRELVQNAFDAYKFSIYNSMESSLKDRYKKQSLIDPESFIDLYDASMKLLSAADIRLMIALDHDKRTGKKRIRFAVCDNGEGIKKNAVQRMRSVGERGHRKYERTLLPGWIKATGEFGIGLHSSFAVTDKINYRSFSPSTLFRTRMELTTEHEGSIVVYPQDIPCFKDRQEPGTDVWIDIEWQRLCKTLSGNNDSAITDELLIYHLESEIRRMLAPNIAPVKVCIMNCGENSISARDLIEGITAKSISTIRFNIPSVFSLLTDNAIKAKDDYLYKIGISNSTYSIATFNRNTIFNGNRHNLCLSVNFGSAFESMKISHKGSWITGGRTDPRLRLNGLSAELHILGRTARSTVTANREALLAEAVPGLARDLTAAFWTLLIYLAKEHQLENVEAPEVLSALACHYRVLLQTAEEPETQNLAQAAIEFLRDRLQYFERDEYYYTWNAPDGPGALEACPTALADIVCEDPVNCLWLRDNLIFQKIVGYGPAVQESSLTVSSALYQDVWESYDLAATVDAFYVLSTGSSMLKVNNLVVKYRTGTRLEPAFTDERSFALLLKAWAKQSDSPDPVQFIPAVRLPAEPPASEHPLRALAVKACDYRSYPMWKLFRSFIKMPVLFYARQFDQSADSDGSDELCYSNLAERCPDYLEMLVNYSFENQIESEKYDKDAIRNAYRFLLEKLAQ